MGDAGAGQPVRHRRAGGEGHRPDSGPAPRCRRDARLPAPARAAGRLPRSPGDDPAGAQGAGDEAEDRAHSAVPGGRPGGRRHRPRPPAGPDLLARRAGAADHLAPGRHARPGAGNRTHRRLQSRHLPDAGDRPGHHADALAAPSRRRPAIRALEGPGLARRAARGLPGRCRDRRGPGDHDRRGHAGAGYALGIPVRRPVAGEEGGTRRLPDRAAQGAGPGGDRHRRPGHGRRGGRRRPPMATIPATTTASSASRCSG